MNTLKKIPFFLPLLAVFFCLHGSNENFGSVNFKEIFLCGLSVLITIILFFAVFFFLSKRKIQPAAFAAFFTGLWFFFFGALHDFIRSVDLLSFMKSYAVIVPVLVAATIAWWIFVLKKPALWPKFTSYLNVLLIIYCVIDLAGIIYKASTVKEKKYAIEFNYAAAKNHPDVFLMVFDEYPGQKSLQDSFHFSNNDILQFLQADSFHVIPSASNYNLTEFSMPSFFNMEYIPEPYPKGDIPQKIFQQRHDEINRGEVFSVFAKMGYQIENNSMFDVNDIPGSADQNSFILGHSSLLTDKIFLNRFNKEAGASLPAGLRKNIPFLTNITPETHRENNLKTEKTLLASAYKPVVNSPVFSYSHFLLPHNPYYFDSSGNALPKSFYENPLSEEDRPAFISYLKYSNTVIKKLITVLHNKKPDAIVILMSDHGFRHYLRNNSGHYQPAHFNNIFAVKFPDGRYGHTDSLTNVNFFRYIFNNQFGQQFKLLPDSSIDLF